MSIHASSRSSQACEGKGDLTEESLRKAQEEVRLAHAALLKGAWELALTHLGYAAGIVDTLFRLAQTGNLETTAAQDDLLIRISLKLEVEVERVRSAMGNGHKMNPSSKRQCAAAADYLLEQLEEFDF